MIFAKTCYKTHNGKFLAMKKTFKIWQYYPERFKHKILVFIHYNNLFYFINTKNLSSYLIY